MSEEAIADFMNNVTMENEMSFPLEVSAIKAGSYKSHRDKEVGRWCSVRPVGDTRTYVGVYLGDLMASTVNYYHRVTKELTVLGRTNPALFVPALKRVVWGYESWWGFIESPEQLREITDADIDSQPYVQALRAMVESAQVDDAVDRAGDDTTG